MVCKFVNWKNVFNKCVISFLPGKWLIDFFKGAASLPLQIEYLAMGHGHGPWPWPWAMGHGHGPFINIFSHELCGSLYGGSAHPTPPHPIPSHPPHPK